MKRRAFWILGLLLAVLLSGSSIIINPNLGSAGPTPPTLLFDSINATGEGAWSFDGNGSAIESAGQYNLASGSGFTATSFILPLNGNFWADFKTYTVSIWNMSGDDLGTLIGSSDATAGSSAWNHTNVTFTCSTPIVVSASTSVAITVQATSTSPAASNMAAWYTTPTVISGQLTRFTGTTNNNPGTFPNFDLQLQIYGTSP